MTDSIKVEQTTDYDKFKTIDANRKVSDKMAKHYAQSLVDNGNWLKISPVVDNLREIEDVLNYERSLANRVRVF